MAGALGVSAGIVGITAVALHSLKRLLEDIHLIKDVPQVITSLTADLEAVELVLTSLSTTLKDDSLKPLIQDLETELSLAVTNCSKSCDSFRQTLNRWLKHSTEAQIFWWDRVRIGMSGESRIRTFTAQLGACKTTVIMAVNSASLISSCRQVQTSKETQTMILQAREEEIMGEHAKLDRQLVEAQTRIQRLSTRTDNTRLDEEQRSRSELLAAVKQERASLEICQHMCDEALSSISYERTRQKIHKVKVTTDGRLLTGYINVNDNEMNIDQDIEDVVAASGGRAILGVAKGIDINEFFRNPGSKGKGLFSDTIRPT